MTSSELDELPTPTIPYIVYLATCDPLGVNPLTPRPPDAILIKGQALGLMSTRAAKRAEEAVADLLGLSGVPVPSRDAWTVDQRNASSTREVPHEAPPEEEAVEGVNLAGQQSRPNRRAAAAAAAAAVEEALDE